MARLQIVSIVGMENILFFVYNFILNIHTINKRRIT